MRVGLLKEITPHEARVALTPLEVRFLTGKGIGVWIERGAGRESGFADEAYAAAGAVLCAEAEEVWGKTELVVKVKEPLQPELAFIQPGQTIFCFLHLVQHPDLLQVLLAKDVTAIGYETVETEEGSLPLLAPMSAIAGRMAVQVGVHFLEWPQGGRGILLEGLYGVPSGKVVVLGGGVAGTGAAKVAIGMGARVTVFERDIQRITELKRLFGDCLQVLSPYQEYLAAEVLSADLLIGAVLVPGERTPRLIGEELVRQMRPGSVVVDVSIDQGGCVETSRVTTHGKPVLSVHGVLHYGVANMPGAVPHTATLALANVTLPYISELAHKGLARALEDNQALRRGVNVQRGEVVHPGLIRSLPL